MSDDATAGDTAPRRRRRWRLGVAVLVLALGALGAAFALGLFEDRYQFRRESEAILTQLSRGEARQVYEGAAFPFREAHLLDGFADLVGRMNATLGEFRGIREVDDVERNDSLAGDTAMVTYTVDYEHARTGVTLSYLRSGGGAWQLLGLDVAIPSDLAAKAEELEASYDRIKAPAEAIALVDSIMEQVGRGEASQIVAAASPPFQESVSPESFAALLAAQESALGRFVRVLAVLSSAQNAAHDRAQIDALLEYEKVRTTGRFDLMRVDGTWKLLSFKVVVPEPLLPAR